MNRISALLVLCAAVAPEASATWVDPAAQAMAERQPERAVQLLRQRLARATATEAPRLTYLYALALHQAKRHAEAIEAAGRLREKWPKSELVHKADFLRADAYAALKDYRRADEIYLAQATELVSGRRKEEIAGRYLRIADAAYAPKARDEKPAYVRAEKFYRLALGLELPADRARFVRYRIARCLYLRPYLWGAVRELEAFLMEYKTGEFVARARYTLGRAYQRLGRFREARRAFRDLLDLHGDDALAPKAAYHLAATHGMPAPHSDTELERGVRALRDYAARFPRHEWVPKADLEVAEAFRHRGRLDEAIAAYRAAIERHGAAIPAGETKPAAELARLRQEVVARAKVRLGDALHAQRRYADAIAVWRAYLREHPADRDWDRAQRAILDAELAIAADHYVARRYGEARERWEAFLARYPLDPRAPRVMRLLGQLEYDQGRWADAVKAWRALVSKYPSRPEGSRGHYELALTLADKLGDRETALRELEAVRGAYRGRARALVARMREEALRVVTERIFARGETPRVKVVLRNLERLSVRLYRVDMETYFRRTQRMDGVERLDLALIAPDRIWEEKVAGFVRYQEGEHEVKLPVREPGVYAVTVSGGKREATTVVHVTDLALITKASRRDLLVFALDARRNRPWPGARILVSDGRRIVLEGRTGDDGVWHARDPALATLSSATVFAYADGHVAGTAAGPIGGVLRPMTARGLVYTDRPAYRAGDRVNLRAIVRRVERGSYTFSSGEVYALAVIAPNGRTMYASDVSLDDFGTAATAFALDANAPVGHYRIELAEKGKKNGVRFAGSFQVQVYRLEKVLLDVLFDRPVFLRGERITGRIRARYPFGEPVVGKKVAFTLQEEGVRHEVILPTNGEVAFSFESRPYDEDQTLTVAAELADEGVSTSGRIRVATEELAVRAKVERPLYLAGDAALVTVEARDVLDRPRAATFTVEVFHAPIAVRARPGPAVDPLTAQTLAELRLPEAGQVRVGTMTVVTAADTGRGIARFVLPRSGTYVFRARVTDRFGNTLVASASTTASGDDDAVRLRIFSDTATYRVGDRAAVRIHSRADGERLALVTLEGEGVIEYHVVRVRPGTNPFSWTVGERHAPNVRISVAMLDGADLVQASSDFEVQRGLKIAIVPEPKTARPGSRLRVRLVATDPRGRPARASISLAAVNVALYALFPDTVARLADLFYGQRRDIVSVTAASRAYRHEGESREVSDELLAEDARRAEEHAPTPERAKKEASIFAPPPTAAPKAMPMEEGEPGGLAGAGAGVGGRVFAKRKRTFLRGGRRETKEGAPGIRVRKRFLELAHWSPAIVTDARGEAVVEIALPDNPTTWRLTARGTTAGTLVGEATEETVARDAFFVETRLPAALTEGDVVKPVVRLHNDTGKAVRAAITASVTLGTTTVSRAAGLDAPARGTAEASLDPIEAGRFQWGGRNEAVVETVAKAGALEDRERVVLPLRPWGSERRAAASGTVTSSVTRTLALPDGALGRREMVVTLGPAPDRLLLGMALSRQGLWPAVASSVVDWALITQAVLAYLRGHGRGGPETARLEAQLADLARSIVLLQLADGGVAWAGRARSNPWVSARALRALWLARASGVPVPDDALARLTAYVGGRFRALPESDHLGKAALLRGLVHVGDPSMLRGAAIDAFASANRLYRLRDRLSPAALAHLTLALDHMGRTSEVAELSRRIAERVGTSWDAAARGPRGRSTLRRPPWFRDDVTAVALLVDALQRGAPTHPMVRSGIEWLLARRWGFCWYSPRLTEAAVQALARYHARTRFVRDRYRVAVRVNDAPVADVDVDADGGLREIRVPVDRLRDGPNRVTLELSGRGVASYAIVLTGFTRGIAAREKQPLNVKRHYEPAPRRLDGKALPRGFGILAGPYRPWRNALTQLPVGERTDVTVEIEAPDRRDRPGFLVVEEPIPAGTAIDRESIRGDFLHREIRPDRIVFLVAPQHWRARIRYSLFGVLPGAYRVLPTKVTGVHDPGFFSSGAQARLEVLEKGAVSADPYEPTPDEDYARGRAHFEAKRHREAEGPLARLLASHGDRYTIRDDTYREVVRMLLDVALEAGQADRVVRYFEILKEKYSDLVIPLEKSVRIARAYMAMNEHERGLQVLRATAEASFNLETQVGGNLDRAGEVTESARFVRELVARYPDLPIVQTATYGLAQHLVSLEKRARTEPALKRLRLEKGLLLGDAIRVFWDFLSQYPTNPTADEAAFALANAYLAREEHAEVIQLTRRLRKVYPESAYLGTYEYLQALASFALERYDDALRLCRRVATEKYLNERKELVESDNKDLAILILGQIHHALGQPQKALEEYRKVQERFPDAREAIESFERVALSIPEVTTVAPGAPAVIPVRFRNVTDARVTVYRVDLMKLYLLHRDLNHITRVNLAGIRPLVERQERLATHKTYREETWRLRLPIRRKGAYLVVLKGKEVEASGMLLVTNLKLDVREDAAAGRVRVQVLDRRTSRPVRKVFVRVVGSESRRFHGDTTDLRGVLTVGGVGGRATVIAAKGDSYAFHRGTAALAVGMGRSAPAAPAPPPRKPTQDFQQELERRNLRIQNRARQFYEQQLRNVDRGLKLDMLK